MVLLNCVPYLGIIPFIVLGCLKGTKGNDRYGIDPLASQTESDNEPRPSRFGKFAGCRVRHPRPGNPTPCPCAPFIAARQGGVSLRCERPAVTGAPSLAPCERVGFRVPHSSRVLCAMRRYRAVARPGGSRGLQALETTPPKKRASAPGLDLAVVCFLLVILSAAKSLS